MKHGGLLPPIQNAARARAFDKEVTKLLNVQGNVTPVEDPFSTLAMLAGEIVYVKDVLREKVECLESLEDVGTDKYATQLHVLMQAYERFLGHSSRLLTDMSKLDLESRIARLRAAVDSATAAMVGRALAGALDSISLDSIARDKVLKEFGNRLRSPALTALPTPE